MNAVLQPCPCPCPTRVAWRVCHRRAILTFLIPVQGWVTLL